MTAVHQQQTNAAHLAAKNELIRATSAVLFEFTEGVAKYDLDALLSAQTDTHGIALSKAACDTWLDPLKRSLTSVAKQTTVPEGVDALRNAGQKLVELVDPILNAFPNAAVTLERRALFSLKLNDCLSDLSLAHSAIKNEPRDSIVLVEAAPKSALLPSLNTIERATIAMAEIFATKTEKDFAQKLAATVVREMGEKRYLLINAAYRRDYLDTLAGSVRAHGLGGYGCYLSVTSIRSHNKQMNEAALKAGPSPLVQHLRDRGITSPLALAIITAGFGKSGSHAANAQPIHAIKSRVQSKLAEAPGERELRTALKALENASLISTQNNRAVIKLACPITKGLLIPK